jgi:hypothetical protein
MWPYDGPGSASFPCELWCRSRSTYSLAATRSKPLSYATPGSSYCHQIEGDERRELGGLASRRKTAQGLAERARIILLAAEELENKDICCGWRLRPTPPQ